MPRPLMPSLNARLGFGANQAAQITDYIVDCKSDLPHLDTGLLVDQGRGRGDSSGDRAAAENREFDIAF